MAGSQAIVQPLFDDLILHISPDKFYFESLTATQVGVGCVCEYSTNERKQTFKSLLNYLDTINLLK